MSENNADRVERRQAFRMLTRGARRRCPHCGASGLFRRWVSMVDTCPSCGLRFDRGEADYFIGGYAVNFIVAEVLVVAGGVVGIFVTWPDVPWNAIMAVLILLMIPAPALFYPFAKTLWLAIDLIFRPATSKDFVRLGEHEPGGGAGESLA